MSAFFIVHRQSITDPEKLKHYRDGIGATIAKFGGNVLVRADGFEVLEGDWHSGQRGDDSEPERVTVIEFPDMDALHTWYNSSDYAALKAIRQDSTVSDAIAVHSGRTP
jgi:uncharacterized protein (DUF1330 family)